MPQRKSINYESVVRVRICGEDRQRIEEYIEEHGITISDLLREGYQKIIYNKED